MYECLESFTAIDGSRFIKYEIISEDAYNKLNLQDRNYFIKTSVEKYGIEIEE